MIETIKNSVNKNAWLFLAAAWLYTLSFIFTNYLSYSSSASKVAKILSEYIQGQEKSFKIILHDTADVAAIIKDSLSKTKEEITTDAQGIFAYQINDIGNPIEIFWNTNKMNVASEDIFKPDGNYIVYYQNGVFEFIKKTIVSNNTTYFFCSLIPIHWQYFLQNEYLKSSFAVHEEIGNSYEITEDGHGIPVQNSDGKTLFSIKEKTTSNTDTPGNFSIFLRITSLLILFIFINNIASEIVRKKNFISGFTFLIVFFFILRLVVYLFPFPFDYQSLKLFSSSVYYASPVNNSLGNLILNSVLLLWVVIFFRRFHRLVFVTSGTAKIAFTIFKYFLFLLIPLLTFNTADIISGLVTKSAISFNAADFFSLDVFSFLGFAVICIILYIWLYLTGLLLQILFSLPVPLFWQFVLFISCSFFLISIGIFHVQTQVLLFGILFLLFVAFFIKYKNNPSQSSLVSSSFFIIWALIVTAAASALIIYQNRITEKASRVKIAEAMQQDTDSSSMLLLRMAFSGFNNDFFETHFYELENKDLNKRIRDSLTTQISDLLLNKYAANIYFFDHQNQPLFNNDSTNFEVVNSVFENKALETSLHNMQYYKSNTGKYNYIYKKSIYDDDYLLGSVFVLVQSKGLKNDALVPELFKQLNDVTTQVDKGYAFGIYDKRKLISAYAGFNFSDSVAQYQMPKIKYYYTDSLGYSQLWYNEGNDKLIIIVQKNNWFFNYITLFAYLFVLFIVLAFVVHESKRVLEEPVQVFSLNNLFRFNIRTQIQTTIIGVSILSFLIIGAATISFFIYRFNKNTTTQLINSSQVVANEIKEDLNNNLLPGTITDVNNINPDGDFEKRVLDISNIHNADINVYGRAGNLIVSSQPYIYSKGILSNKINTEAYYEMHYRHSTRFVHTEKIGTFSFQSIYLPVKDENDETIAYLNIPLLSSHSELQEEISDFLITVIILNALIFIFAGAISVTITGRITSSLELIGSKMKQINVGSTNEEIVWQTKDEIGLLVDEYNKMVKKLEENTQALVRSEREGAWRQMARQVAHEIKNPLTPMKLSIQYLQRAMENNTANAVELSKRLASSLIEQIDQLSKIASDFSQFANIEQINLERFDVTEVIQSLINIYNIGSRIEIKYNHDNTRLEILYDRTQINRLFTNLIKNAIEAAPEKDMVAIYVNQFKEGNYAIISVHDNGHGVKDNLQSKIFDPNFTTKSSGTGLGLAICKAIVEKANGKIWFITAPDEGTSFFVELPLAQQENQTI